jgi:hypothetical protein
MAVLLSDRDRQNCANAWIVPGQADSVRLSFCLESTRCPRDNIIAVYSSFYMADLIIGP